MSKRLNNNTQETTDKVWIWYFILFLTYIAGMIISEIIYSFTMDDSVFYIVCAFVFLFLISIYLTICYLQYVRGFWVLFSLSVTVLVATLIGATIHVASVQDITGNTIAIATAPLILSGLVFIAGSKKKKEAKKV